MPKTKKKFIEKKNSVTFHVVHRSQHDPLITDETAPQHVLVPQQPTQSKGKKNKEEETKYGIYFDDDYDYLQHLKECRSNDFVLLPAPINSSNCNKEKNVKPKVMLPSSIFESEVEEKVGMLNKASPQSGLRLDLDPDIVAAMDDDFNFEDPDNELEDDFVIMANQKIGSDKEINELEDVIEESDQCDSEAYDDVCSLNMDDTKSRFTDYSMSSSIIRRNENLKLLDDQFEQMFAAYDDAGIGALETEEIEGTLTLESDMLKKATDEFESNMKRDEIPRERSAAFIYDSDSDQEEPTYKLPVEKNEKKWDCESIISTYSNVYNHPALIKDSPIQKIRINPKTGIPILQQKLTAQALKALDSKDAPKSGSKSVISALSMLSIRNKNETPEEKLKRKKALKEFRHERRAERKANTLAFREQKKKLEKEIINKNVNKTVRVI